MNLVTIAVALLVGFVTGALFTYLQLPLPAPPALPGVVGIVGIYLGYVVVERLEVGFDVLAVLGL